MKAGEFPNLEKYETSEIRKEMEQKLPKAFEWSLILFLGRQEFLFKTLQSGENWSVRAKQVEKLNRKRSAKKILERIEAKQYLEGLAILDISFRYLELDLGVLDLKPKWEQDAEWKTERDQVVDEKNTLAYHRDRMIEKEPRLRQEYTKKDFEDWARKTVLDQQNILKDESNEKDRKGLLERISVLHKVLTGASLSKEDISMLLLEINSEMALYREGMGEIIINYLLGEKIKESQLLDYLRTIIKFRQFQVGIESREWVNAQANSINL